MWYSGNYYKSCEDCWFKLVKDIDGSQMGICYLFCSCYDMDDQKYQIDFDLSEWNDFLFYVVWGEFDVDFNR